MEVIHATGCSMQKVSWDQYLNALSRERATHVAKEYSKTIEYSQQVSQGPSYLPECDGDDPPTTEDSTYVRRGVKVENFEHPNELLKRQLLAQLDEANPIVHRYSDSLEESIEQASVTLAENFGGDGLHALVDLGDSSYLLAPVHPDSVKIRLVSLLQGAAMVYTPMKFVRFKLIERSGAV